MVDNKLHVFTYDDFLPFAVFKFTNGPFELTKSDAIKAYVDEFCDPYFPDEEETFTTVDGPKFFWLRKESGEADDFCWHFCDYKTEGAKMCYGYTF